MKKVLAMLLSVLALSPLLASAASIRIKVAGASNKKSYYLCIPGSGCMELSAGSKGAIFPVNNGDMANLYKIVIADISISKLYTQPITESCNVVIPEGKTMTVYGTLVTSGKMPEIKNLRCTVS